MLQIGHIFNPEDEWHAKLEQVRVQTLCRLRFQEVKDSKMADGRWQTSHIHPLCMLTETTFEYTSLAIRTLVCGIYRNYIVPI